MSKWTIHDLKLHVDAVLRGQGADPAIIRSRSPQLVEVAHRALGETHGLLEPQVLSKRLEVKSVLHNKMVLEGDIILTGPLVTQFLVGTESLMFVLCTIGSKIDQYIFEVMSSSMVFALAIDGVGSAAVEALANAVCMEIEVQAQQDNLMTTIPLNPGMIGWSVEQGQQVIFKVLEASQIGVELTPQYIMNPRKSLSMLIGLGSRLDNQLSTCDFCAMKETCCYKDSYRNG